MYGTSVDSLLTSLGMIRCTDRLPEGPLPTAREAGFFHPALPFALQVIGSAADPLLSTQPWRGPIPRVLVIGSDARVGDWKQLAGTLGLPCYWSHWPAQGAVDRVREALGRHTALRQHLHATLVRVLDLGLLLLGASGAGKSELALDLVSRGHQLVADDAVDLSLAAAGCLLGECPEPLRNFIEVRGLGIVDLRAAYGDHAIAPRARIALAVRIDHADPLREPMDRLQGRRLPLPLLGVVIPEIILPARLGHNAVMVEAACRDHWLRLNGYVSSEAFIAAHDQRTAGRNS